MTLFLSFFPLSFSFSQTTSKINIYLNGKSECVRARCRPLSFSSLPPVFLFFIPFLLIYNPSCYIFIIRLLNSQFFYVIQTWWFRFIYVHFSPHICFCHREKQTALNTSSLFIFYATLSFDWIRNIGTNIYIDYTTQAIQSHNPIALNFCTPFLIGVCVVLCEKYENMTDVNK